MRLALEKYFFYEYFKCDRLHVEPAAVPVLVVAQRSVQAALSVKADFKYVNRLSTWTGATKRFSPELFSRALGAPVTYEAYCPLTMIRNTPSN